MVSEGCRYVRSHALKDKKLVASVVKKSRATRLKKYGRFLSPKQSARVSAMNKTAKHRHSTSNALRGVSWDQRLGKKRADELRADLVKRTQTVIPFNRKGKTWEQIFGKEEAERRTKRLFARLRKMRKPTSIELLAEESLVSRGIPFFSQKWIEAITLPDQTLADAKIAIFEDGCFFHACELCYPKMRTMLGDSVQSIRQRDKEVTA